MMMNATNSGIGRCLAIAMLAATVLAACPDVAQAGPLLERARALRAERQAERALSRPVLATAASGVIATRAVSPVLDQQEAFYARALQLGVVRVPRPQGLDRLLVANADGTLPDSPIVDYLQWRRGLNTPRFDSQHPFLAPILERDRIADTQVPLPIPTGPPEVPTIPPAPDNPPIGVGGTPSQPQLPVPELSSLPLWIALAVGGAFALIHRRAAS